MPLYMYRNWAENQVTGLCAVVNIMKIWGLWGDDVLLVCNQCLH